MIDSSIDSIPFKRLLQIMQQQLQHRLILNAEKIKIELSEKDGFDFSVNYLFPPFDSNFVKSEIFNICDSEIKKIINLIKISLKNSDGDKVDKYRVFITGGMSNSPILVESIQGVISPGISIRRLPALKSVVAGLAVVARQLSLSQSIYTEPKSVRGIPIEY